MGTALKVRSLVISLKVFPANMFKSMNLVFCVFPAKGIPEWGEENSGGAVFSRFLVYSLEGRAWNASICPGGGVWWWEYWGAARQEGACTSKQG